MSDNKETKGNSENVGAGKSADKKTWLEKNMANVVGGGTFTLLFLIALVMYFANN